MQGLVIITIGSDSGGWRRLDEQARLASPAAFRSHWPQLTVSRERQKMQQCIDDLPISESSAAPAVRTLALKPLPRSTQSAAQSAITCKIVESIDLDHRRFPVLR